MTAGRKPVIVVEDDVGMRDAIHRVLAASGFAVTDFASAETALHDRSTRDACCLIVDVHLGGISGFELYERLGAMDARPPVIFITARDDARTRERADRLGALAYLVKPFSGRELAGILARVIP